MLFNLSEFYLMFKNLSLTHSCTKTSSNAFTPSRVLTELRVEYFPEFAY